MAAIAGKSMMKFESGYNVETVFDGSKLGIEPYAVEVLSNGELLILDSENSNIYKISSSLSLCKCANVITSPMMSLVAPTSNIFFSNNNCCYEIRIIFR